MNWTGAVEVARDDEGSTAVCPLVLPGITMVQVQVIPADGGDAISSQSRFNVVDVPIDQITVSPIDVWVASVEIDADLPQDEINEQTMGYFFGPSIAALRDLGDDQYRTSVNRMVQMSVEIDPPGFAPLIEWRFDGEPVHAPPALPGSFVIDPADGIGTSEQWRFLDIGNHLVEVGPWLNPEQIEIETYSVTITSDTGSGGQYTIPQGEPVVFIAETDPPGYENDITWLSSTKYGTAEPILGEGPIFIAEFNDTWGVDENGDPFQWLGVKADNAAFNQDQKEVVPAGFDCWLTACSDMPEEQTSIDFAENPIPADFFEPGSDPFDGVIVLGGAVDRVVFRASCKDGFQFFGSAADCEAAMAACEAGCADHGGVSACECPWHEDVLDTLMSRSEPMDFGDAPSVAQTPLEVALLSFQSCQPIIVIINGEPTEWDVFGDLSEVAPDQVGLLIATRTHENGGTFTADFFVQTRFTFTRVDNPDQVVVLDTGLLGLPPAHFSINQEAPWVFQIAPDFNVMPLCGTNFAPGVAQNEPKGPQNCKDGCYTFGNHHHCVGHICFEAVKN